MSRDDRGGSEPRRRFELGCGHIVLVLLLVAVVLAIRVGQIEREKAAAEAVRRLGGIVLYGKETVPAGWFYGLMPARVVSVEFAGARITNADLATLKSLTRLERLDLDRTPLTSGALEPVAGLTGLQMLSLEGTAIGDEDLPYIARLTKLRTLKLSGTQVSDAGLDCLDALAGLETLSISDTKITDAGLSRLCALQQLQCFSIDESQVTSTSVVRLRAMKSLQRLSVHIPHGTGKRTRDLLAPLRGVDVSGFRRVGRRAAAKSVPPDEIRLWDASTLWEITTGGVVEAILATVPLRPEDSERLLDVLAEARPTADWQRQQPGPSFPLPFQAAAVPNREPIQNAEEFFQGLKHADSYDLARAIVYARTHRARTAISQLLDLLKSPDEELRRRAVTVLIRSGLEDRQAVAAIREMLRSYDMRERARTIYAFDVSWMWSSFRIAVPKLTAAEAEVAVSLLLEMPEDEYWEVRSGVAEALASIVKEHPQEAERALPIALKTLNDSEMSVRFAGPSALEAIVYARPRLAKAIVQQLLDLLQDAPADSRWLIVEALQRVAPQNAEAAATAVPALLRLLRDKKVPASLRQPLLISGGDNRQGLERMAVPGALGRIVVTHPEHVPEIVRAALPLVEDEDPAVRLTASLTLSSVAQGFCTANARLTAKGKPPR